MRNDLMQPGNKILINCREATSLDEMRREGKLGFRGRFALWGHLLYCKFCRLFIKQSVLLGKYTGEMAESYKTYTLSADRKEMMKKALQEQ